MFRVITSSKRVLNQHVVRSTLAIARAQSSTDPQAGSVGSGNDAFGKKEHAEEARWARRRDIEQMAKYRTEHPSGGQTNAQGTRQQRLAALELEKQKIQQEIDQLKRQS